MVRDERCHIGVKRRQDLRQKLDDADLDPQPFESLCRLQADETSAHDDGLLWVMLPDKSLKSVAVRDRLDGKDILRLDAGNRWNDRACAWRQDQFVIGFRISPSADEVFHAD